jgi:hypothetical protein
MKNVAKGAAIGIVVALAVGTVIGYFLIPMIFPLQASDSRQTFWLDTADTFQANSSMVEIDGLGINYTTEAGDIVIIELACSIGFVPDTSSTVHQQVEFELFLDEIWTPSFFIQDTSDSTDNYGESVFWRFVYTTAPPGPHNVTVRVQVTGSVLILNIGNPSLTVQIV